MTSTTTAAMRRVTMAVGLGALMATTVAAPIHAQDDTAADASLAAVREARDAAKERIDEIQESIETACAATSGEICAVTHVAGELPAVGDILAEYATTLEGIDVPEEFSDDLAVQLEWLAEAVEGVGVTVATAAAYDQPAGQAAFQARLSAAEELVSNLEPAWAAAAFVTSLGSEFDNDIYRFAGDVTDDERAYLNAVRQVPQAASADFACFSQALNQTYGSTEALLGALTECGAGEAVAKNLAAAQALDPPARFASEHEWLLAGWEASTRYDKLIGEAAAEGDIVKFMANNALLGIAFSSQADLDPAFVRGAGFGSALDPTEPLAQTDYGRDLFAAMLAYDAANPLGTAFTAIGFPQVPREEALPAVLQLAPKLLAIDDELQAAIAALEPPAELAQDHAAIVEFFATYRGALDDYIGAAESGDVGATFAIENASPAVFCDATAALSDEIRPVVEPFFDPNDFQCR